MAENLTLICICWLLGTLSAVASGARKCPPLRAPMNGRFEEILDRPGRFQYFCRKGFILSPSTTRSCRNGRWSGIDPECISEDLSNCPVLPTPTNGAKRGTGRKVGSITTFYCNIGYQLIGSNERRCIIDYTWTGTQPECESRQSPMDIARALKDRAISPLASRTTDSDTDGSGRLSAGPNGLDIAIVMDCSSSIHPVNVLKSKAFAKMLVREFGISANPDGGGNGTRFALISFGDVAQLHFNLNDPDVRSIESSENAIDKVNSSCGGTNLREALMLVYSRIHKKEVRRLEATRALFLITDGKANIGDPVNVARDLRKQRHFEIFAIGVGTAIDKQQLKVVASHPYAEHVFVVQNHTDLESIGDIISEKKIDYHKCGVSGNIETGGLKKAANKGAWPWLGWLNIFHPVPRTCGGALICQKWFLTAAHCLEEDGAVIDAKNVELYLGDHILNEVDESERAMKIHRIHIHPDYNSSTYENSIALIELGGEKSPVLDKFVRPLCAISNISSSNILEIRGIAHSKVWVTGWGHSPSGYSMWPELHQVTRQIAPKEDCQKAFPNDDMDRFMCVGDSYLDDEFCRGDIGGPISAMLSNNRFVLFGVAVETRRCVDQNSYGRYINVLHEDIISWIGNTTGECSMPE
ncbi:hypothetical protein ScPMuIL_005965 [Solemya velum]